MQAGPCASEGSKCQVTEKQGTLGSCWLGGFGQHKRAESLGAAQSWGFHRGDCGAISIRFPILWEGMGFVLLG